MSRTGVEAKPAWKSIPSAVRRAVGETLGADVMRAMRIYGGYSPTPTFRLRLSDGRRAFFKAVSPNPTEFTLVSHRREERVYRELQPFVAAWSPAFYGSFERDGWRVMLLEDLGPSTAPPWKPGVIRGVSRALGDFHRETSGVELPAWLPRPLSQLMTPDHTWTTIQTLGIDSLAALAGDAASEARRWLNAALPVLSRVSRAIGDVGQPYSLIHRDIRSDNLRWVNSRLHLLDWPHAGVGPAVYDVAAFAQSVEVEGGPSAEQVIAWYGERFPVRDDVLDTATAALASFFATHAPQPEIPGLPRLRAFQRAQLRVTLAWAARRLMLPEPSWLDALP